MHKPTIALITGFARNKELVTLSLKPLLSLRRSGIIDEIVYVVGDDPALDAYASYVTGIEGVRSMRTRSDETAGLSIRQDSLYSQINNLKAGLDMIGDDDALVLKTRPDFVIEESFLASKILNFDTICAPTNLYDLYDADMPKPIFKNRVWLPWADANMFFFYDDSFCLGLKQDLMQLTRKNDEKFLYLLDEEHFSHYNNFFHTWRFSAPFLDRFPIFRKYMDNAPLFHRSIAYRCKMVEVSSQLPFFWLLLIAHTWILATHFHVDIGRNAQMQVFSTHVNKDADWSKIETLKSSTPFSNSGKWRGLAVPGGFTPFLSGAYSRMMDDRWLNTIFTKSNLRDMTSGTIEHALELIASYESGNLAGAEADYFRKIAEFQRGFDAAVLETAATA